MKYMTFNSSCSYAGLANLLSFYGVDTEDRSIALEIHLPYLFSCEDGQYLAGPMLQGAKWFNLYLHPIGFTFTERRMKREDVCSYLRSRHPAMLGLHVTPESRHAVIYTGGGEGEYHFLNNRHESSPEPADLRLSEKEFLSRLDETVTVGMLKIADPVPVALRPYLEESLIALRSLEEEITAFCSREQPVAALREARGTLFRPILLDGVTMLELLMEEQIAAALRTVRAQLMAALREDRPVIPARRLDMALLTKAMTEYAGLIEKAAEREDECP
ncbi:MAG: hypothetical protein HDT14_12685 [Oscillibacter sp.]|nr:hypothetical protein [Oscillibacter sp.]